MNPRLRRLAADSEMLRTEFAGHPNITVIPLRPEPSDAYRVTYMLRGVVLGADGETAYADQHTVTVQLPSGYPREKPIVAADTAVFHPNFGANPGEEVCIGDYWSPARGLADIIVTIGEMIQFQKYNVRSPLNPVAARWVAANEAAFPVGMVDLYQAEPDIVLTAAVASTVNPAIQTPDRQQQAVSAGTNAAADGPEHTAATLDGGPQVTAPSATPATPATVPSLPDQSVDTDAILNQATAVEITDAAIHHEDTTSHEGPAEAVS